MTTTDVWNYAAFKFGQQPMKRPHGKYRCGACQKWFALRDVSIFLVRGWGCFLCGPCNIRRSSLKRSRTS